MWAPQFSLSSIIIPKNLTLSTFFSLWSAIFKMKQFLNNKEMQILVQSLVISSLDYCNALYCGTTATQLKQLQMIQNRACRTVLGLKRKTSVENHLKDLHWLKINEHIEFKLLLLTHKASNGLPLWTVAVQLYQWQQNAITKVSSHKIILQLSSFHICIS